MSKSLRKNQQSDRLAKLEDLLGRARDASSFTELTYLLSIVSALNSNDNLSSGLQRYRSQAPDKEREIADINGTTLDSIAAILVQEHEIVAACFATNKVSMVVAETDPNSSTIAETDPNSSTAADDDTFESLPPGSHSIYPLELATISNPDFSSSSYGESNINPHRLQTQSKGYDLWAKVRDYKWHCVLM